MRNELAALDKKLEKLNAEKTQLETALAQPGLAGPKIADLGRQLSHVQAEIAMGEERWLELTEQIEAIQSGG